MAGEKGLFIGGCQIAVIRNALVEVVRHEVKDVFFKIGSRTNDAVDFSLANHLGERNAQLGRAHRASECHEHDTALVQVPRIGLCGVSESGSVEVAIVEVDELRNWAL